MPTRDPAEAEALSAILERVRAAKGPDRGIDLRIAGIFQGRFGGGRFSESTEDVVHLIDEILPGYSYSAGRQGGRFLGSVGEPSPLRLMPTVRRHQYGAALALLDAAFSAKLALTHQEASHDGR